MMLSPNWAVVKAYLAQRFASRYERISHRGNRIAGKHRYVA